MSMKQSPQTHYKDYKDALDYQSASRIRHQLYSSPTSTSSSSSTVAASQNLSKKLNISASVTAIGPIQSPSQTQTQSQFDYRYWWFWTLLLVAFGSSSWEWSWLLEVDFLICFNLFVVKFLKFSSFCVISHFFAFACDPNYPLVLITNQFSFIRTVRSDASLIAPIRQTASIFKQPVTVIKSQEGKVKSDLNNKQGSQEKPRQLVSFHIFL